MSADTELLDQELRRYQELVKVRVEKLLKNRSSPTISVEKSGVSTPTPGRPATILSRLRSMLVTAIAKIEDSILGWFRRR